MKLVFIVLSALWACTNAHFDIEKYLTQFGYYNPHQYNDQNVTTALLNYQKAFKLPQTGVADKETLKLMHTPRCGVKDNLHRFAYADKAWRKKSLTYYFHNYSPDLSQGDIRSLTRKAFDVWSAVTPLRFTEQRNGDIVIAFGSRSHSDNRQRCYSSFDGPSGVLAHAFFPPDGRLHFDEDERYTKGTHSGTNYFWVAAHELGHILGLEHDQGNKDAVMYPYYRGFQAGGLKLHSNDIRRIQRLYGRGTGGGGPVTQPPTGCSDRSRDCYRYRSNCQVPSWRSWINENCRKTCGICSTGGGPVTSRPPTGCSDKSRDCYRYKHNCKTQSWKTWINENCRQTCGLCGTGGGPGGNCEDKHTNCQQYKNNCNTSGWVDYMNKNCNKTCGCRA